MRLDSFLVGLLMMGIFVSVGFALFVSHIESYDIENANDSVFAGTHGQLVQVFQEEVGVKEGLLGGDVEDEDTESSMFRGGFKAIRGVFSSVGIAGNVSQTIVKQTAYGDEQGTGIVDKIFKSLMVLVAVLFSFTVIAYIFRFQPK